MFVYEHEHGHLPPAVVYGQDGTPLYSWRVAILPYLEEHAIYNEFHLDEPWDSPHNLALVPKMPQLYALPPRKAAQMKMPIGHTICHVFVGPETPFEEGKKLRRQDFSQGETILLIEAGEPVPWSKPVDLHYEPSAPLPNLNSPFKEVIRLVTIHGSRIHMRKDIDDKSLRAGITRSGRSWLASEW